MGNSILGCMILLIMLTVFVVLFLTLVCEALTHFKLDPYKLFEALPQLFRERLNYVASRDEGQDVEPNGLDILCHLLSTASRKKRFWSESEPARLSEQDTKCIFFDGIAKSSSLPVGANCLLYVCVFTSWI
jgi:hypothetical protein